MRAITLALALVSGLALAQSTGPGGASSSGGSATSLVNVDAGTVFSPGDITAVGTLRTLGVAAANIVDAGTVVAAEMRTVNLDGGNGFYSGNVTVLGTLQTGATPAAVATKLTATGTIDFASTATGACALSNALSSPTGASDGMPCTVGATAAAHVTGAVFNCWWNNPGGAVTTVQMCCVGGSACDPASATYTARFHP